MTQVEPSLLANSVMSHLYDVLTNGDDTVPKSEDNFFSWCTPGIPFREEDFEFLTQGLTGVVKKAAIAQMRDSIPGNSDNSEKQSSGSISAPNGNNPEQSNEGAQIKLTPAELEKLRAQDTAGLSMQSENFARLVDFVPDISSATNDQFAQLSIMSNEGSLSERYEYILRMSQVMKSELPEETKKKIEKFRGLLNVSKVKKNILDDSETIVQEPSPMVQAYNEKLSAYQDAALEYNARRIDGLAAEDAKAVHFWSINANILRNRVKAAMNDWVANGFKNEYEQIGAFIDQVMQRDMSLLKEEYRDDLLKAQLTGLASGSDFYYTSLVPGNFVKASGWTEFTFNSSHFERHRQSSYNYSQSASRSRRGVAGLLGFAGRESSSSSASGSASYKGTFDSDSFYLKFKVAQVPIVRPWFKTAFLNSKTWRFDQSNLEAKGQMVSDGGKTPKGLIPAYPTMIVVIKDLEMCIANSSGMSEFEGHYSQSNSSSSGGGFFAFGSLNLGGSYNSSSSSGSGGWSSSYEYDRDTQTMKVPGLQVIGFKCHIVPKSPNPLPEIKDWI
jgi:hypothetical protein